MVIHARVSDWLRMQSAYLRRCDVAHFECSSWHSIIVVDHRRLAREKRRVLRRRKEWAAATPTTARA